ncbi:hypothetical protein A8C56_02370 [Niabella ginsenosidivorans]|uniref:Uncharacterized protein n=1 Tax=Niabella ginsenosidivorans TaxID=1176587 RepID=A0A1A9HZX0_9BACT|nr:hypothetical protein A8C56_02370 [Niabella ginsenosidivorans]
MTKTGLGFNVSYNLSWAANHKSVTFKLIGMTIFSIVIPGAARDSQKSRGSLYYQRDASAHSAPLHPE